jgi:hypothetical protein
MSQPGAYIEDLDSGTSWALIAHSALPGAGGIMAGSSDIAAIVGKGGIAEIFVFPTETDPPGIYLWWGSVDADGGQCGITELLHPDAMQLWLDRNGEAP